MKLERVDAADPRAVLRALRGAVLGAGPAIAIGAEGGALPDEVPPGTALVVTTSGSTGVPKSVVLSRNALTAGALATAARVGEGAWLLALPAGYIAGAQVLVRSLVSGHEPAILAGRFSPEAFAAAAASMASSIGGVPTPTFTSLVPVQVRRLLDAAERDDDVLAAVRSFAAVLVGGQALAPVIGDRAAEVGMRLVRTYGSTETSGGCVYDGVPLDATRVRIIDDEVQLSGPTLADGYLGDEAATSAAFPRDEDGTRWYRTGDTGEVVDGVLRVLGRRDNVVVSGGENISLDRVERAVRSIPGLESAVVVGVPDPEWGEVPVLVAASDTDAAALWERVREVVANEVGRHARPHRLVLVEEVPLLGSGKPDRVALRRHAASA
ncbi:AMP-binding protein [Microbacterium sp. P05]|uniref:AMP-binding protein n=1 Tax=Microbacterium sp. P05 TaxID=3366948 RepID=UPI0037471630